MPSHFERFVEYFKNKYDSEDKELIMGELQFKELYFANVGRDRAPFPHVVRMFVQNGFLIMLAKSRYIINLDAIRAYNGAVEYEKL